MKYSKRRMRICKKKRPHICLMLTLMKSLRKKHLNEKFGIGYDKKIYLKKNKSNSHYLNCGMFGHFSYDCDLRPKLGGWVTFGGNPKRRIAVIGKIGKHHFPFIENVLYIEGLKHKLLSISKICDYGYDVFFNKGEYIIWHKKLGYDSLRLISKLNKHHPVRGLPNIKGKGCFESKTLFQLLDLYNCYIDPIKTRH
ncbi:hypothetical protein CR513_37752, partial [Mucuna pruriens]